MILCILKIMMPVCHSGLDFMEDSMSDQAIGSLKGLPGGFSWAARKAAVVCSQCQPKCVFFATDIWFGLRRNIRWGECKYIDSGQPSELNCRHFPSPPSLLSVRECAKLAQKISFNDRVYPYISSQLARLTPFGFTNLKENLS
jgi:hypothetical protein